LTDDSNIKSAKPVDAVISRPLALLAPSLPATFDKTINPIEMPTAVGMANILK
jgi:hypothetical protein